MTAEEQTVALEEVDPGVAAPGHPAERGHRAGALEAVADEGTYDLTVEGGELTPRPTEGAGVST